MINAVRQDEICYLMPLIQRVYSCIGILLCIKYKIIKTVNAWLELPWISLIRAVISISQVKHNYLIKKSIVCTHSFTCMH